MPPRRTKRKPEFPRPSGRRKTMQKGHSMRRWSPDPDPACAGDELALPSWRERFTAIQVADRLRLG
jgi:hypothetical protein